MCFSLSCSLLFKQSKAGEYRNQRIGHGGHGFDEDVQRNAHNDDDGVAYSVDGKSGLVSRGVLSVPVKHGG